MTKSGRQTMTKVLLADIAVSNFRTAVDQQSEFDELQDSLDHYADIAAFTIREHGGTEAHVRYGLDAYFELEKLVVDVWEGPYQLRFGH